MLGDDDYTCMHLVGRPWQHNMHLQQAKKQQLKSVGLEPGTSCTSFHQGLSRLKDLSNSVIMLYLCHLHPNMPTGATEKVHTQGGLGGPSQT